MASYLANPDNTLSAFAGGSADAGLLLEGSELYHEAVLYSDPVDEIAHAGGVAVLPDTFELQPTSGRTQQDLNVW